MAEFIKIGEVSTYSEKETEMFLKAIENTEFSVCKETFNCDDDIPGDNFILMLKDKDDPDEEEYTTLNGNTKLMTGELNQKSNIDILKVIIKSHAHTCSFLNIEIIKEKEVAPDCTINEAVMSIIYEYNADIFRLQSGDDIRDILYMNFKRHEFITDVFSGEQTLKIYI